MAKTKSEWDQRILCSDGNCIGIIGADGRCKECGTPYEGKRPLPVAEPSVADEGEEGLPDDRQMSDDPVLDTPSSDDSGENDDVWEDRILCVDESCIGVVGSDGRCRECGKPYPG